MAIHAEFWRTAAFIIAIAALTDVLDGRIARRHGSVTFVGALADGMADKLVVQITLVALLLGNMCSPIILVVNLAGDLLVGTYKGLLLGLRIPITSNIGHFGKLKSVMTFAFLFWTCLMGARLPWFEWLAVAAALLTMASTKRHGPVVRDAIRQAWHGIDVTADTGSAKSPRGAPR